MNHIAAYSAEGEICHHIDPEKHQMFLFHVQKAVFLSLLRQNKLTQHQYQACCEKLRKQIRLPEYMETVE